MRSLALLLLLINLSVFVWQLGFFPWLPWQPEQFTSTPTREILTEDLPTLHLLHETMRANDSSDSMPMEVAIATSTTVSDQLANKVVISTEKALAQSTEKVGLLSQLATHTISQVVSSTAQHEINLLQQNDTTTEKTAPVPDNNIDNKQSNELAAKIYCYDIGPYTNNAEVKQAANWFKAQKALSIETKARETPILQSTRVYLPPYGSRQAAKEVEKRLVQQGIDDKMIITKGELSNGISLGVYRDQESVERRLRQLKEKGYANVQTEKIYKTDTKYWLTVKISAVALLDVFKKTPSVSTATSVECK